PAFAQDRCKPATPPRPSPRPPHFATVSVSGRIATVQIAKNLAAVQGCTAADYITKAVLEAAARDLASVPGEIKGTLKKLTDELGQKPERREKSKTNNDGDGE